MPTTRPILIVEDDAALRTVLCDFLATSKQFHGIEAATLADAKRLLIEPDSRFDAIILDLTLPDGDGCEFCAAIRKQGFKMPVLIVTGATSETDIVRGLEAGANDYITKPFRFGELIARLNAQLRTFDKTDDAVFVIGPYTFRPGAKLLVRSERNQRIRLTTKEVDILRFLYRAKGHITTRQVLLDEVWGYSAGVTTHTLETHIYRLRQKIEPDTHGFTMLLTLPAGYQLNVAGEVPTERCRANSQS